MLPEKDLKITLELLKKSKYPLIISKQDPTGDSIGSMLALYLALKKLGKNPMVACHGNVNIIYRFLPNFYRIVSQIESSKEFIISVNVKNIKTRGLSYTLENDKLHIFIDQEKPILKEDDVEFSGVDTTKFDLIIALNCPDLDDIGEPFEKNSKLFYELPIINIDHRIENSNFGKINLVSASASSTSEILYEIFESLDVNLVDKDVATCLLTGIIADTNSFQSHSTTPSTLATAAKLIRKGADRKKIVQYLFKTKELEQIKLWGKVLLHINYDENKKIAYSAISQKEFESTGAYPNQLNGIADEILQSLPEIEAAVILIQEKEDLIHGAVYSFGKFDAKKYSETFGGKGNQKQAIFKVRNYSLDKLEKEILDLK